MRSVGCEEFFACFGSDASVFRGQDAVPDVHGILTSDLRHNGFEVIAFDLPRRPWCEVSHLPIVAILCKKLLWSDVQNLAVVEQDTGIESDVVMPGRRSVLGVDVPRRIHT